MKLKTSISLSEELIRAIDRRAKFYKNRSDFIVAAIQAYLAQIAKDEQDAKDLGIINKRASYLNKEAEDVLSYQIPL
jgi:metal-responsive CopG/Arc/MetJ family transcriptional regulator